MLLFELNTEVFFFPFYCRVILFFVEECLKNNLKNSKKIMKSDMGIPCAYSRALWPLYKYP